MCNTEEGKTKLIPNIPRNVEIKVQEEPIELNLPKVYPDNSVLANKG